MNPRRLIKIIPLVVFSIVFFSSQPARATSIWFVSPTGNDSNECDDTTTPCRTIKATIDKASAGDRINVMSGTYSTPTNAEVFPIKITKSLTLWGYGPETTIIDATGTVTNVIQVIQSYVDLDIEIGSLTIKSGVEGICAMTSDPTYLQVDIVGNKIISNTIGIYSRFSTISIRQNDISGNSVSGIKYDSSTGEISRNIMGWNGGKLGVAAIWNINSNVTIVNNLIGWNTTVGILNETASPNIINNTIAFNYGGGIANTYSSNPTITNNIIVKNWFFPGIYDDETSSSTNTYNNVWFHFPDYSGTVGGTGSISADPRIVSWFDAHLRCSSPAINAGFNSAPHVPSVDFDGNPRPVGGVIDMGAYEKQSDLFCPVYLPFITR